MTDLKQEAILVFLDLETTGLNPRSGEILELAMFATNLDGDTVSPPFEAVFHYDRDELLPQMDDYVLQMHLKSGLLSKVWGGMERSPEQCGRANRESWRRAQSWMSRLGKKPKAVNMAGNSIHFDRSWLLHHQPDFAAMFSYRMLDISSFLIMRPDWRRPENYEIPHRALADAQDSHKTYVEKLVPILRQGVDVGNQE